MAYSEFQKEEIKKCAQSFEYWCSNYVHVMHPVKGLMLFELYEFQKRVVRDFETHQFNIVKKFRQAGLTTVAVIWALWRCMFKFDQRIMVLSKTDREATGVGKIVEIVKDNFPDWMKPVMKNDALHEKEFEETGGIIWFYTPSAARSKALTYLIIDEAAFIEKMDDHWKAMYPTLSTGGNCIAISTVNGVGNWYEETYTKAQDKKNQFHIIDINYKEHPDYASEEWAVKMRANLGEKGWLQEICGEFFGSGKNYIDLNTIMWHEQMCCDPVSKLFAEWDSTKLEDMKEEDLRNPNYEKGAMWIWKEPKPNKEYFICADAGEGMGKDNSAFIIMDSQTFEQQAEFYSNTIPIHKFAQVLDTVGKYYNEASIVLEHEGLSHTVLNRLEHSHMYPNIYREVKNGKEKVGISLNRTSRPVVLETFQTCMLNKLVKLRSFRIIRELRTFNYNESRKRPEATKGKHDDLIMALALGLYSNDVASRNIPAGYEATNKISSVLTGKNLEEIRKQIYEGLPEDFIMSLQQKEEEIIMPKIEIDDPNFIKQQRFWKMWNSY